jgi:hypothetical protein
MPARNSAVSIFSAMRGSLVAHTWSVKVVALRPKPVMVAYRASGIAEV